MRRTSVLLVLAVLLAGCSFGFGPAVSLQNRVAAPRLYESGNCTASGPTGFEPLPGGGEALVGEDDHAEGSSHGECTIDVHFYEARIRFDLAGSAINHASLSYRLLSSKTYTGDAPVSCADALKLATVPWGAEIKDVLTPADDYLTLPVVSFPTPPDSPAPEVQVDFRARTFKVDVTSAVNDWLSGRRPNNGFVLTHYGNGNLHCLSRYTDFALALDR